MKKALHDGELKSKLSRIFDCCSGSGQTGDNKHHDKDPTFTYLTEFKGGTFEYDLLIADIPV